MLTGDGLCQHVLSIALQQIILLQHATLTINRATQNEVAPLKSLPYFQGCQIRFVKIPAILWPRQTHLCHLHG